MDDYPDSFFIKQFSNRRRWPKKKNGVSRAILQINLTENAGEGCVSRVISPSANLSLWYDNVVGIGQSTSSLGGHRVSPRVKEMQYCTTDPMI